MYFEQYLAIDYGTTSIKGVLFKEMLGTVTILRHESLKLVKLPDSPEDEYEYNIVRFIQSFFPEETNFLVNLPVDRIFIRELEIPLGTEKAVKEIMPFEVENVVPFPIETLVVQGNIWNQEKESSSLITFSAHHDDLTGAVKPFLRTDIQLKCVSTDSFSLSSIIRFHFGKTIHEPNIGQLDIGGDFAIFNASKDGKLVHSRFFGIGGKNLTRSISKITGLGFEEAEELKTSIDFSIQNPPEEAKETFKKKFRLDDKKFQLIIDAIHDMVNAISAEIDRSIFAIRDANRPKVVYLSGGGSLFKDLDWVLTEKSGISFKRYDFLELDSERFVNCLGTGYHYRLKRNEKIDFLTEEFSRKIKRNNIDFGKFKPHIIFTLISLFILSTVFVVSIIIDKRQIEANNEILREKFKQGFGKEAPEDADVMDEASKEVRQEQNRSEIVRKFLNKDSILELILDITQNFPTKEGLDFVLDQFSYDGKTIQLWGRVDEYSQIGTIEAALRNSKKFKNIEIRNKNLMQGVTKFKVRFEIKLETIDSEKTTDKAENNAE